MKTTHTLQLLALTFLLSLNASAQPAASFSLDRVAIHENVQTANAAAPHVAAYIADPFETRDASWWNELNEEISLEGQSYKSVSVEALQNAIFFQSNHPDRIDLTASLPTLLDVYFYHKSAGMRIMAMTSLCEIGDAESLQTVEKKLYKQPQRVRDFASAALTEYRNQ